jgi:hypothetical protein
MAGRVTATVPPATVSMVDKRGPGLRGRPARPAASRDARGPGLAEGCVTTGSFLFVGMMSSTTHAAGAGPLLLDFYYASHDASRVVLLICIRVPDRSEGAAACESRLPRRRFGAMIHPRYAENEARPSAARPRHAIGDDGGGRRLRKGGYSFIPIEQPSCRRRIMYSFHICYGCFADYLPIENPTEPLRFPRASSPTPTDERASS